MAVTLQDQIARLEAALAAPGALRLSLGDATVDVVVGTLRVQVEALRAEAAAAADAESVPAGIHARIPHELGERIRAVRRVQNERRRVTVLFADLSGYTALCERLDPE